MTNTNRKQAIRNARNRAKAAIRRAALALKVARGTLAAIIERDHDHVADDAMVDRNIAGKSLQWIADYLHDSHRNQATIAEHTAYRDTSRKIDRATEKDKAAIDAAVTAAAEGRRDEL